VLTFCVDALSYVQLHLITHSYNRMIDDIYQNETFARLVVRSNAEYDEQIGRFGLDTAPAAEACVRLGGSGIGSHGGMGSLVTLCLCWPLLTDCVTFCLHCVCTVT
jgi:hypothetical protein